MTFSPELEGNATTELSFTTEEPENIPVTNVSDNLLQSAQVDLHMKIVKFLDLYIEGLIMFAGIIGNLLILLVFIRRKVRHSSCIFIRVLSVTDFLILSICLNTHWINYNFNKTGKAVPLCKTILVLTTGFFDFEAWVIVSMTIDRFISVTRPFHAKVWCTPARALLVLLTLFFLTGLKNWYIILIGGFQYNKHLGTMICTFMYDKTKLIDRVYPWLDLVWGSLLPLIFIITLNAGIIRGLRKSAQSTGNATVGHQEQARRMRDRQITVSLVVISFVFLLLTLPRKIFLVYFTYAEIPEETARILHSTNYLLALSITDKLWFSNCSINIWLFSLSGSRFRKDIVDVLLCRRKNKVSPTQNEPGTTRSGGASTNVTVVKAAERGNGHNRTEVTSFNNE